MTHYLARRLVLLIPLLLGVSLVSFGLMRLIPGDPAQIMMGEHASAEQVARFRMTQGFDQPILVQYLHYLAGLIRLDMGRSLVSNIPVTSELAQRLPATIELSLAAMGVALLLGLPAGILSAHRRNSPFDWLVSGGTTMGAAVPLFVLGLLLSYLFAYRLSWLPPSGRLTIGTELWSVRDAYRSSEFAQGSLDGILIPFSDLLANFYILNSLLTGNLNALTDSLRHLVLPAITLSVIPMAVIARMTRTSMLDILAQDYSRTASAKGLQKRTILITHVLRNAALPILTVSGLQLGLLFSGAILTETIFSWPGMGQLVVDRVLARDYPVIQGVVLVSALLFVTVNLIIDISCRLLDPSLHYE